MMNKIKAIVIDDEYLNRDLISKFIIQLNQNFEIVGEAEDVSSGFNLINKTKPDVVFLDIKMPDGTGFDLLKKIPSINFEVIFVTGFDQYAINAFEFNALDYVLKPIDIEKFKNVLEKAKIKVLNKHINQENLLDVLSCYKDTSAKIYKIPIHHKDKVVFLEVNKIVSIQSDNGYTSFAMDNKEKFISSKQMISFEFIFNAFPNMVKLNKSTYINLDYLKSYSKGFSCTVNMVDNSSFEISRRKKTEILSILDSTNSIN